MSSEVSFASESIAFRFLGRSSIGASVRAVGRVRSSPKTTSDRISATAPSRSDADDVSGMPKLSGSSPYRYVSCAPEYPTKFDRVVAMNPASSTVPTNLPTGGPVIDSTVVRISAATARTAKIPVARTYTSSTSGTIPRHDPRFASTRPRWSLLAIRADKMPRASPRASRSGGITTSSAGNARNDASRSSMVSPASMPMMPASDEERDRLVHDAAQHGQVRAPAGDEAHDAQHRAEDREYGRHAVHLHEGRRKEQARQRYRVAGRGHDGRGDVVEIPVVAHAERRGRDRDRHHDDDRDDPAEHRDDDEVGDRDRRGSRRTRPRSPSPRSRAGTPTTSTARPRTRGSDPTSVSMRHDHR